jgi:hypothetical protein
MKKVKLFDDYTKPVVEGKDEDEARAILQDLLDEYDPYELVDMMPEDAYETVAAYGHKGKKAEKIATALLSMAQNGEFESKVTEANADGTISDDEDQRRDELEMEVYHEAKAFAESIKERAYDIGGSFRGPGIQADMAKQIKKAFKDAKFRI